jgi:hypothetical protein
MAHFFHYIAYEDTKPPCLRHLLWQTGGHAIRPIKHKPPCLRHLLWQTGGHAIRLIGAFTLLPLAGTLCHVFLNSIFIAFQPAPVAPAASFTGALVGRITSSDRLPFGRCSDLPCLGLWRIPTGLRK